EQAGEAVDDLLEVQERRIDVDCTGRAGERGRLARRVEAIAFGNGVRLAFPGTSPRAFFRVRVQEEAEIRVGEDHRTDVATLHDQAAKPALAGHPGLAALVGEQG